MKRFYNWTAVLAFSLLLLSCGKEDMEKTLQFPEEGGAVMYNDMTIDGSTMVMDSGDAALYLRYDFINDEEGYNADWIIDGGWVRVYYSISRSCLYVIADKNETGSKRTSVLTATEPRRQLSSESYTPKNIVLRIVQSK